MNRVAILHIDGAAAVVISSPSDELKRTGRQSRAALLYDVEVPAQQHWLVFADPEPPRRHSSYCYWNGTQYLNVALGKSGK